MAKATATMTPRALASGATVVDVQVLFTEFPRFGAHAANRPHAAILKNNVQVFEDQPFFYGAVYQLDTERVAARPGDILEVVAWWDSDEVRDGEAQPRTVVGRW